VKSFSRIDKVVVIEYKVVYSVNSDLSYFFLVLWLFGVGFIGFRAIKIKNKDADLLSKISNFFIRGIICIMLIIGSMCFLGILAEKQGNVSALSSGNYSVTEGYVENFDPAPTEGHKQESFTVNGNKFRYYDHDLSTGAFNQTRSHGGPIYEGRWVRLCYKDGLILKIEVRE
jgi:hypothetical protein